MIRLLVLLRLVIGPNLQRRFRTLVTLLGIGISVSLVAWNLRGFDVVRAQVRSAAPLDAADLEAIRDRLSAMTGKTVQLVAETDAGLLGGVVVQIGDTVYDGSIRTRLDKMGRRLAGA